jgi:hypothetical protein
LSYQRIYNQEKKRFGCLRCGHVWFSRRQPHYCAYCKSSLWNKPRKYHSPETGIKPTEKRTAATGRAAAKQRPERIRTNPARACHDCGTTEQIFKSIWAFPFAITAKTRDSRLFFKFDFSPSSANLILLWSFYLEEIN